MSKRDNIRNQINDAILEMEYDRIEERFQRSLQEKDSSVVKMNFVLDDSFEDTEDDSYVNGINHDFLDRIDYWLEVSHEFAS